MESALTRSLHRTGLAATLSLIACWHTYRFSKVRSGNLIKYSISEEGINMKRVNKKYSTLLAACLVLTCGGAYAQSDERNERTVRDGDFRQVEAGSKGPWQIPNDESSQAERDETDADNNMRRDASQ